MGRLVVVSNRVPALDREATAGGLAVGVAAALEETGGLWFGWSGQTAAEPSGSVQIRQTDTPAEKSS
jgi:trehalose 6-phosphate synthase